VSTIPTKWAAGLACALGLGQALISAYWALGGTELLDTIGGSIERWGREREPALIVGLWLIVIVKVLVAVAAPVLAGVGPRWLPAWTSGKVPRILGWVAAIVLVLYGGVLTIVGLLAQASAFEVAPDANRRALAWHAFVWDPWFLAWGVAFCVSLWLSRPDKGTRLDCEQAAHLADRQY
jgi:hypothetical protein